MAEQSFANHVYRPTLTLLGGILTLLAMVLFAGAWLFDWRTLIAAGLILCLAVLVLGSASRASVTRLQDRIILLEMKVRCAELLPAGQDALLNELSTKQVVACASPPTRSSAGYSSDRCARSSRPSTSSAPSRRGGATTVAPNSAP